MSNKSPAYLLLISLFIAFSALYLFQAPQTLSAAPLIPTHAFGTIPPTTECAPNPWQHTSSMVVQRHSHTAVATNNTIYVLGGSTSALINSVESATLNFDGTLSEWQLLNNLTQARRNFAAVVINQNLYALGGWGASGTTDTTERATINSDGTLGAWQAENLMTIRRGDVAAVTAGNYVYVIGGWSDNGLSSVERAAINPDGSLGQWHVMNSMTTARYRPGASIESGYIYAVGGVSDNGTLNSAERSTINPDGSLGIWQPMNSMHTQRDAPVVVIKDGYIYALGGYNVENGANYLNSVERAKINPDGTLAAWEFAYPMNDKRGFFSAVVANNKIYAIGGSNLTDSAVLTSVEFADTATLGPIPDYQLSINEGSLFTNQTAVTLTLSAKPDTVQMQVSNDGGFSGAQWEPCVSTKPWAITQFGNYVIPRVVYTRFKDKNGNISSTFQDDIILDVTPPTGSVTIGTPTGLSAAAASVTLTLKATDDVSGVGAMSISSQPDFGDVSWQSFQSSISWAPGNSDLVYVKFRDNAGNSSPVYSASIPSSITPTATSQPIATATPNSPGPTATDTATTTPNPPGPTATPTTIPTPTSISNNTGRAFLYLPLVTR